MKRKIKIFVSLMFALGMVGIFNLTSVKQTYASGEVTFNYNRYQESYNELRDVSVVKASLKAYGSVGTKPYVYSELRNTGNSTALASVYVNVILYSTGYQAYQIANKDKYVGAGSTIKTQNITREPANTAIYYEHRGTIRGGKFAIRVSQFNNILNY